MTSEVLKKEIVNAIFILETSLATQTPNPDIIMIGDVQITRKSADDLKGKLNRYNKGGKIDELFKAIPPKLCVHSQFWRNLQLGINEAYTASE